MSRFTLPWSSGQTEVHIGPAAPRALPALLATHCISRRLLVLTDQHVAGFHAGGVCRILVDAGFHVAMLTVPPGETSKSLAQLALVYDRLAELRIARDGALVAVGGGVVSDLAGFAAATWMRGVPFAICPTTVEAAIDAGVGGKTGINHSRGKNLIGAFHHPVAVAIDPDFLRTLPDRDFRAGLAESVKHAAIADESFLDWHEDRLDKLLARDADTLAALVDRNIHIKAAVVRADERERTGRRAVLNFGHTIGHAVEAALGYELRHGEAVAIGMVAAGFLSHRCGKLGEAAVRRLEHLLDDLDLPRRLPRSVPVTNLLQHIEVDKKTAGNRVRLVLLDGWGRPRLRDDVPPETIKQAIAAIQPESSNDETPPPPAR